MTASAYRSAWADPEHVRLAEYRSWWDQTTGPSVRLRAADPDDPWLVQAGSAHAPLHLFLHRVRGEHALPARADWYAAARCSCRHLVYSDDLDGGFCRFCRCCDHSTPACAAAGGWLRAAA